MYRRYFAFVIFFVYVFSSALYAQNVQVDIPLANPYVYVNEPSDNYMKIALHGQQQNRQQDRSPINLSLVLDKSGSMSGDKLLRMKEAAMMVLDRLDQRDYISIIVYDTAARVLVAAQKMENREAIKKKIGSIRAGGSTALFAGVVQGAGQVRENMRDRYVNRIILISDGIANIGPHTPNALAQLGTKLGGEGISVTTIGLGLGYNEDLMSRLALQSDGNHAFAQHSKDLLKIFNNELGDVMSVVAQRVKIKIKFYEGVTPHKSLGRNAKLRGREMTISMNNLYAKQEKYVLVKFKNPVKKLLKKYSVAQVQISYYDMNQKRRVSIKRNINVIVSKSRKIVLQKLNKKVKEDAILQSAVEKNRQALALRDAGKIQEAKQLLINNAQDLKSKGKKFRSKKLSEYSKSNMKDADSLMGMDWQVRRKQMRKTQNTLRTQQAW